MLGLDPRLSGSSEHQVESGLSWVAWWWILDLVQPCEVFPVHKIAADRSKHLKRAIFALAYLLAHSEQQKTIKATAI